VAPCGVITFYHVLIVIEIRVLRRDEGTILANVAPDVFDDLVIQQVAGQFLGDPRHHLAVAIDGNLVVGFASGVHYLHPDKPQPEFWINEVGVAPAHQAQGLGKALMRTLLAVAQGLGCAEAWVLTERNNTPAMRLYKAIGGDEAPDETVMFTFHLDHTQST
jgi:ribosomal protein S18 acetylase RimI-like enzyme